MAAKAAATEDPTFRASRATSELDTALSSRIDFERVWLTNPWMESPTSLAVSITSVTTLLVTSLPLHLRAVRAMSGLFALLLFRNHAAVGETDY